MITVTIVGGSGYTGGDLLRILLFHPAVEIQQVTSERHAGKLVSSVHPNLRKICKLKFVPIAELEPCDVMFLGLPHGQMMNRLGEFESLADTLVDLSADFRLRDKAAYETWYGKGHACPDKLDDFVYGIAELHRDRLKGAKRISGAGCNATATILALHPLYQAGVVESAVVEVKAGSSQGGNAESPGSHHPERSGAVRSYKPTAHPAGARRRQYPLFGHLYRNGARYPRHLSRVPQPGPR
jgi:N-acetyl-gamma-glutamyl-phosphate/LysW-gamma-L-alpha-aminoadipyl-6-phosphate reductase